MGWGNVPSWAAVVISLVALGVSVWGKVSAHRSAGASQDSAREARRSADAAERQTELMEQAASKYEPPWDLSRVGKTRYLLTNEGDEPCHDVTVESDGLARGGGGGPYEMIGPREAVSLIIGRAMGESDMATVTWSRPGSDERLTWNHVLPS